MADEQAKPFSFPWQRPGFQQVDTGMCEAEIAAVLCPVTIQSLMGCGRLLRLAPKKKSGASKGSALYPGRLISRLW
jgi:hypothetical protein